MQDPDAAHQTGRPTTSSAPPQGRCPKTGRWLPGNPGSKGRYAKRRGRAAEAHVRHLELLDTLRRGPTPADLATLELAARQAAQHSPNVSAEAFLAGYVENALKLAEIAGQLLHDELTAQKPN